MDGAPTLEVVFHEFRRQCLRGAMGCTRGELADTVELQPACGLLTSSKYKIQTQRMQNTNTKKDTDSK